MSVGFVDLFPLKIFDPVYMCCFSWHFEDTLLLSPVEKSVDISF